MKKDTIIRHIPLLYFLWASLFQTLGARWVAAEITIPYFAQVVAACVYVPFAFFCGWKLLVDIKELKQKKLTVFNLIYYAFALYFVCLTAFRFGTGMDWKDSIYYFAILYGSLSMAELILKGHIPTTKKSLAFDIWVYVGFLLVYRVVYCILFPHQTNLMPINLNIYATVLAFALFTAGIFLSQSARKIVAAALICAAVVGVTLIGARAVFTLMLGGIAAILLVPMVVERDKKKTLTLFSAVLAAMVVVVILFAANVGNVRYAIYRETNLTFMNQSYESDATFDGTLSSDENQNIAEDQISRSDSMREALMRFGMEEVKKNFWFGTGKVLFEYQTQVSIVKNPAHNIILETMNAFGFIGLLVLAVLIIRWLVRSGIFAFHKRVHSGDRLMMLFLLLSYGALSMVQAISYGTIVLPMLFISFCCLQYDFRPAINEHNLLERKEA